MTGDEKKHIHFIVPTELYEEFHRIFPGRGEKTAFFTKIMMIAVEKSEEFDIAGRVMDEFLEEE